MVAQPGVGLFVDFEEIRRALVEDFGQEPDCQTWMSKALHLGPVAVAYAYADFARHPAFYRRRLEVAGITPRDVAVSPGHGAAGTSTGMTMLMDIVECLLDLPSVGTLLLVTHSPDFVRIITRARNRFGKQVVVSGVPGAVSSDLIGSADRYDPMPVAPSADGYRGAPAGVANHELPLLQLVIWLARHRPYMTFGFIRSHATSPHHGLDLTDDAATELLSGFKDKGILVEHFRNSPDGRTLRTLELCHDHPAVVAAARMAAPRFETGINAAEVRSTTD